MKVNDLEGAALDWAVAKCEGIELSNGCYNRLLVDGRMSAGQKMLTPYNPSTDWGQGGPLIERERIAVWINGNDDWTATDGIKTTTGETALIAAMRCYIASRVGDEIEVPDELTEGEVK